LLDLLRDATEAVINKRKNITETSQNLQTVVDANKSVVTRIWSQLVLIHYNGSASRYGCK
jgi:hypothetical protein